MSRTSLRELTAGVRALLLGGTLDEIGWTGSGIISVDVHVVTNCSSSVSLVEETAACTTLSILLMFNSLPSQAINSS